MLHSTTATRLPPSRRPLPRVTRSSDPDPIFALIEAHRDLCQRCEAAVSDYEVNRLNSQANEIADQLLAKDPTSIAAAAALLRYGLERLESGFPGNYPDKEIGDEGRGRRADGEICHSWQTIAARNVARALERLAR
jgi:hypothetical protein